MSKSHQIQPMTLSSLENIRTRLLDLSARNRLLNYRHGRKNNLRIIDELPDKLHELLLAEEELRFLPVPEPTREQLIEAGYIAIDEETGNEVRLKKDPTADEWARWLGFQTTYDLPETDASAEVLAKHRDKGIQTLLFPYEMESRLRNLRSKASTSIEESGANILYVAFGFLEWFESPESDTPRYAPLLLIPIQLAKGKLNHKTGTYEYTISYSGEDIIPNLSLREKLRVDFGLALPNLDENTTPEKYFNKVCQLIEKNKPRWTVRRYATVGLFNFSKLLMYLDLDSKRWPEGKSIKSHPIICSFFERKENSENGNLAGFAEEYDIDELPDIHERYPLIEDADSSQHSALVDAINGENLVIEGPPGTGKSQTITNLIAAAISQGKKVLFVAEKLAALEVVKRRLDNVGLGDFCLELHSHKTQKRKVLNDIDTRLKKQGRYRHPSEIDEEIFQFENLKNKLRDYATLINSQWKATGKTIHEILVAATRYRQLLDIDLVAQYSDCARGLTFDSVTIRKGRDQSQIYGNVYKAVAGQLNETSDLSSHPWHGVNNADLQLFDAGRVCDALNNWQETLRKIDTSRLKVTALLGRTDTNEISESLSELQQLTEDLALLPELHGDERLDALPQLRNENLQAFRVYLDQFCKIQDLYKCLSEYVSPVLLEDLNLVDHLKDSCVGLKKLGAAKDIDLNTIISIIQRIDRLEDRLREIQVSMAEIGQHLDPAFQKNIKLHEKGLRELYNFIEFTVALDPELWNIRHERFDNEELDRVLPDLQSRITNLRMRHVSLSRTYKLKQLPQVSELEEIQALLSKTGFLCWFKRDWRVARRRLLALASKPDQGVNSLLDNIDELISFARDKEALNDDQALPQLLGEHFRGLDTNADRLLKIRSWYQQVRRRYGVGFGPKVELGQALISMPVDVSKGIRSLVDQGLLAVITESLEELTHLKTLFSMVEGLQRKDLQLIGDVGGLTQLKKQLANLVDPFQNYFSKQDLSIAEIDVLTCDLIRLRDLSAEWKDSDIDSKWFGSTLGLTIASGHDYTAALNAAEHTESLASILDDKIKTSALKQAIYNTPERSYFNELRECGKQLLEVWSEHKESLDAFKALTELNFTKWIEDSGDELSALTLRNDHALENPEWLANWLDYVRVRSTTIESGLGCLVDAVEQGTLSPDDVESGYYLAVYDYLSREILREVPTLAQFSGDVQESIRRQFCEYDQTIKHLQRERIAWQVAQNDVPPGVSGPKASDYTERALLKKECAKQKRHIPVRQLVKRAGNALAALKPCFMMGPMSVAQYLAPGMLYFDLVVMDEASQMKPEEAIGAVARGSQLVVVGDPKQLPPTSFFDKLVDDEDEDLTAIEESESILDAVSPLFIGRRLRWHYRSRHESLICFSNQSFYGGELILFPSPHSESDEFGVKFTRIPKGKFVNRRNLEEAHIIAETVKRHLLKHPEESLGVVAMNVEQRDQIERAVEMLAKEDELLQIAMDRNQSTIEPLFVKNLENVQGDERDVIFISMTYGPQETGGRVMQRFGPINSVNGWRRLNVLFTRAKKRMHVFSSMSSEDIVLSSSSKRGVEALRDFLSFAETGILYKTSISGREPDSDFEIAVAGALRSAGFECVPQVGVAGFYIDIAVRDPGNPGSFLMGIECDGASYHSAKSVCDRDRLRQAILEQLGWNIRRIWSTDWYKNPQAQLQSIIRELNALKTQEVAIPHVKSETEEIESIVESAEEEEQVSASTAGAETLLERLLKFDQEVIRKACPDTPENKRLLRPAMLDALIENMPTSKWEFQESIPAYLRLETSAEDGKYLGRVLEIIDEASIS